MPRSQLTNYLKTERLRCGLSQGELAVLMGLSGNAVGKVERGIRNPSLQIALAAGIIFGQHSRDLFPMLYEAFEDDLLLHAVKLVDQLADLQDARSARKRAHLSALINRLQFHQQQL